MTCARVVVVHPPLELPRPAAVLDTTDKLAEHLCKKTPLPAVVVFFFFFCVVQRPGGGVKRICISARELAEFAEFSV